MGNECFCSHHPTEFARLGNRSLKCSAESASSSVLVRSNLANLALVAILLPIQPEVVFILGVLNIAKRGTMVDHSNR